MGEEVEGGDELLDEAEGGGGIVEGVVPLPASGGWEVAKVCAEVGDELS